MDVSLFELTEAYSIVPAGYGVFITLSFWSCDSGIYGDSLQCTGSMCLIILAHGVTELTRTTSSAVVAFSATEVIIRQLDLRSLFLQQNSCCCLSFRSCSVVPCLVSLFYVACTP